jgi:hypothetical protein
MHELILLFKYLILAVTVTSFPMMNSASRRLTGPWIRLYSTKDVNRMSPQRSYYKRPFFRHTDLPAETLYILDGTSMVYNAYHSKESSIEYSEEIISTESGPIACGALVTMSMHFMRFVRDVRPRYVVAALDVSRKNFRSEMFPEYKQQRSSTPEDLVPQFSYIEPLLSKLGCRTIGCQGYEADDVMATVSHWARGRGLNVCIVSADKDMLQLIEPGVHVMNPRTVRLTPSSPYHICLSLRPPPPSTTPVI